MIEELRRHIIRVTGGSTLGKESLSTAHGHAVEHDDSFDRKLIWYSTGLAST